MKQETKNNIRCVGCILFGIYVAALVYMLFFSESYGRVADSEGVYRYNLVPFVEICRFWQYREQVGSMAFLLNIFGNILGFVPFGVILPIILPCFRKSWSLILSGFCVSLTVETIQLFTKVGSFDVDDLLLNTLGAAIGYVMFAICNYFRRYYYGKKI